MVIGSALEGPRCALRAPGPCPLAIPFPGHFVLRPWSLGTRCVLLTSFDFTLATSWPAEIMPLLQELTQTLPYFPYPYTL